MSLDDAINEEIERVAKRVTAEAKRRAPVDTGQLKRSIGYEVNGRVAVIGAKAEHGIYQELGTRYMNAQPFLVPAVRSVRG